LDKLKQKVNFGPEESNLPYETWASIEDRVKKGAKLVVVDGIVHDVASFIENHPGGIKILEGKIGKDATMAFNGSVYRHSKAARNIAAMLRVSRLPKAEIDLKMKQDNDNVLPTFG
jgi:stearoyl-CoA desaturase (delta-9 desaturase)